MVTFNIPFAATGLILLSDSSSVLFLGGVTSTSTVSHGGGSLDIGADSAISSLALTASGIVRVYDTFTLNITTSFTWAGTNSYFVSNSSMIAV